MKIQKGMRDCLRLPLFFVSGLFLTTCILTGCSDDNDDGTEPQRQSIAQTLSSQARFSYLVQGLAGSGYLDSLEDEGPYTVFAPVNSAFEELGEEQLDAFLGQSEETLRNIFRYHIVPESLRQSDIVNQTSIQTLQGADIEVMVEGDAVVLNDSVQVLETDILATNGVIHAIGGVLTP
ncbi:MAG: fasciclin domain-containing protein [Chitinispirillaceae bacterium]